VIRSFFSTEAELFVQESFVVPDSFGFLPPFWVVDQKKEY
jgi:hypothetical protein